MRRQLLFFPLLLAGFWGAAGILAGESIPRLIITANNLPGEMLYLAVYDADAGGWESEPVYRLKQTLPEYQAFSMPLDLPPGQYAIRLFVDLNDNEQLDINDQGRPVEPYATSGHQRPGAGFEQALITLEDSGEISIRLRYPRGT